MNKTDINSCRHKTQSVSTAMLSVFFVALWVASSFASLPPGWEACKVDSNECLLNAVNIALKSLKNGNKHLGVGPIDPLKIITLRIEQGSGPVSVKLEFQDLDMYGLSSCNVVSIKNENFELLEGYAICEPFDMKGNYKVNGRVLTLPISGNGKCHLHFGVMKANITMKLNEVSNHGKKYLGVSTFNMVLEPQKAKFDFENLFNGDKALSENMNNFLNENSEILVKELTPAFSKGLSQAFFQITTQVFSKIPFDEINIS